MNRKRKIKKKNFQLIIIFAVTESTELIFNRVQLCVRLRMHRDTFVIYVETHQFPINIQAATNRQMRYQIDAE